MQELSSAPGQQPLTKTPDFLLFYGSRVCSAIAYQIAGVAIGWFVYDKTRSALDLGYLGLCQFLPLVVLIFVAGQAADRLNRRMIVLGCQWTEAVIAALLAAAALTGHLRVPMIFAAVTVFGCVRAFEGPTLSSLLPALVPSAILARALAVSSSAQETATILGPSLGGLLYAAGVKVPLALAAALFLTAGGCIAAIKVRQPEAGKRPPVTLKSVFSGLHFVWHRSIILGVISLDLFAVLLGGVTALLPIFARDILHAGPWALGFLRSSQAVGALAMSMLLAHRSLGNRIGLKMLIAVAIFGVATVIFSLSKNIELSVFALVVMGSSDNVSVVIRSSLVQLATPDEMRGRVNAVNSLFIGTSNQLGEFESGVTAHWMGPVLAGVVGGVGTILVSLLWMRLFPKLAGVQTLSDVQPAEPAAISSTPTI